MRNPRALGAALVLLAAGVIACTATVPPPAPGTSVPGEITPLPASSSSAPPSSSAPTSSAPSTSSTPEPEPVPSTEPVPEPSPEPTTAPPPSSASGPTEYPVLSVYDGDTLRVQTPDGSDVSVRVLGIDAPEMKAPRPPGDATRTDAPPPHAECGAVQARDRARALLLGREVELQQDPTQGDQDQYGRWLRYVSVQGQDLGAALLSEGLVWVFEEYPVQRTPAYRDLQQNALGQEIGGWAVCGWAR